MADVGSVSQSSLYFVAAQAAAQQQAQQTRQQEKTNRAVRSGFASHLKRQQEEMALALGWIYDMKKVDIPLFLLAGTEGDFETQVVIPFEAMRTLCKIRN